jgi:glycosyltransferase involved in cell wall biosynthesis
VRVSAISVIIPALNERESIGQVVASLPWSLIAECVVVDNGSTDGTDQVARDAGARVVYAPQGYGSACKAGAEAALATSSILVFLDGDGSDAVEYLSRLVEPIEQDSADFVLGSRIRGDAEPGSMLGSQIFAAHLVGFLIRMLQGVPYTDMGPFRAIRRSTFRELPMSEMTYGWNLEMQIRAARQGLRIEEIPVDYRCRIGGVSKVSGNLRASMKAAVRILGVVFRIGLSRRPA